MKFSILLGLTLALTSGSVVAADLKLPDLFCLDGEQLFDRADTCMDNRLFVDAAENCLDRLETAVEKQAAIAKAGLKTNKGNRQDKNFASSDRDYKFTSANLDYLIQLADMAAEEVDSYLDWNVLPEGVDDPQENGGDATTYARRYPCYAETQDSINSVLKDIKDIRRELQDAKEESTMNSSYSSGKKGSLNSLTNTKTGQQNPEAAPLPNVNGWRNSDISGTKEKKKK